jgi:cytochrome c oxidase subunit 2
VIDRGGAVLAGLLLLTLVPAPAGPCAAAAEPVVRRIEVTARRFEFVPATIEVARGDVVELVLHSEDTEHGIEMEAFGVKVAIPKGGAPVSVSFVASRVGRFPFKCSEYCGSGHRRMRGELVVSEVAD